MIFMPLSLNHERPSWMPTLMDELFLFSFVSLQKKKAMMTFSYLANELEGPNVEFAEGKVYYMSR